MSRINPKRKPFIVIETEAKPASEQRDRKTTKIRTRRVIRSEFFLLLHHGAEGPFGHAGGDFIP